MCVRYLGFLLLIWFPGALLAQRGKQGCLVPKLDNGYFVLEQGTHDPDEAQLTYACDNGHKPVVEGWWATSTCQDGKWSHEPQCIDEKACIPPTIPNAKYTENSNGWYEDGHIIRITCAKGYQDKNWDATAECRNGTWSSVPVCKTCDAPPKIPHAVIINQEYQDVFSADSEVQYECEDGFTVEGADTKKSIICINGNWTTGPQCSMRPRAGQGGSVGGGSGNTCGGHSTSAGCGTRPAGGGSSSSSGSIEREGGTRFTTIEKCGRPPLVADGDVVGKNHLFLKYQCSSFYKRVGPQRVRCYSNGTWSEVPTCQAAFCFMDPAEYPHLQNSGVRYIYDEGIRFKCVKKKHWWFDHFAYAHCTDGRISLTPCCNGAEHFTGFC